MGAIYFLIPISLIVLGFAVWALIWAINSGQYDDLDGASWRVIYDDQDQKRKSPANTSSITEPTDTSHDH